MSVEWIQYKDKKILFVDYRGKKNDDEKIELLKQEVEIDKQQSEKVLCLANYTGTFVGTKYMDEVKRLGKEVRIHKVAKTALLGIEGVKKILLNGYIVFTGDKNLKTFDDEESAKEWLVK